MRKKISAVAAVALLAALLCISAGAQKPETSNQAKSAAVVDAAIKMTDGEQAVKLLWQATEIDPTYTPAYLYLGLYYNNKSDFSKVVEVYQKLVKYQPRQASGYLNIGEAYMSYNPPEPDKALPYYRKAYELDPNLPFAALRIGEILAQHGNRDEAIKYLKQARAAAEKDPSAAEEATKVLEKLGAA